MKPKIRTESQILYSVVAFLGLIITLISEFVSHGNNNELFFYDVYDTGMDFFHSIEYVINRQPYEQYNTIYPPLANLFFYILFCFVPEWQHSLWIQDFQRSVVEMRASYLDLRVWQSTMMLFIVFIIITAIVLFFLIRKLVGPSIYNFMTSTLLFFSVGILCAYERGNIILLSALFLYIFIVYRNANNKVMQEVALISLAISAGLKIYPAFFGMLLIYEKNWKKVIRAVVYGAIFFFLPFLFFEEKMEGLSILISTLFSWTSDAGFTCNGLSMDKIINSCGRVVEILFGVEVNREFLCSIGSCVNIAATVIILLLGFQLKKEWEKLLVCALSTILFQTQGTYILIFLLPVLAVFLRDERIMQKGNILPFVGLVGTQIWLPLSQNTSEHYTLAPQFLRIQCFEVMLIGYVCTQVLISIIKSNSILGRKRV